MVTYIDDMEHRVGTRAEWLGERIALLQEEKALTRKMDELAARRRELPWVKLDKSYTFDGPDGRLSFTDLFRDKRQLVVYHFMFAEDWDVPCKVCSFWADNYQAAILHLAQRDISFVTVSTASYEKIAAFRKRMGWSFDWVSSAPSDFGHDFLVSYTDEQIAAGDTMYNFKQGHHYGKESPGLSIFVRGSGGGLYHTYSAYARGLEALNSTYRILDLVPMGRNEESGSPMSWLRLSDEYAD